MEYKIKKVGDDELYHYGVPGMRWGVRKSDYVPSRKEQRKAVNELSKKHLSKSKIGRVYDRITDAHKYAARAEYENKVLDPAKRKYKAEVKKQKSRYKEAYGKINSQASKVEKIIYNDATRRAAAKYVQKNNMSYEDAVKKAKKGAWRNTAIALGAYGAISVAAIIANKKMG